MDPSNQQQWTQAQAQAFAQAFWESCPIKAAISTVAGYGFGAAMGMFMSSIDFTSTTHIADKPFREQVKLVTGDMKTRTLSSAKSMALIGGVFSSVECCVESFRAKSDMYNGAISGCITGGGLAARSGSGPTGILTGCAGFAAFSTAIDYYFKHVQ